LKELRAQKGFTQDKMVELLGLKHKSHYCQIENGIIKPSLDIANNIAKIFDDSIENIFFNDKVHDSRSLGKKIQAS
jgi:putative transcriptional regulator